MDIARHNGVAKVVHASSMAATNQIFNHIQDTEETALPPMDTYQSAYDITKRLGEEAVLETNDDKNSSRKNDGMKVCALRLGCLLSGPKDYMLRHFKDFPGRVMGLATDAEIDLIAASDVAAAMYKASRTLDTHPDQLAGKALYVTKCKTNTSTKVNDLAKCYANALGWNYLELPHPFVSAMQVGAWIHYEYLKRRHPPDDLPGLAMTHMLQASQKWNTFDNTLARSVLNFEPEETWYDAVEWIAKEYKVVHPHLFA